MDIPCPYGCAETYPTDIIRNSSGSNGVYEGIISIPFYAGGHKYQHPREGLCRNSRAPQ